MNGSQHGSKMQKHIHQTNGPYRVRPLFSVLILFFNYSIPRETPWGPLRLKSTAGRLLGALGMGLELQNWLCRIPFCIVFQCFSKNLPACFYGAPACTHPREPSCIHLRCLSLGHPCSYNICFKPPVLFWACLLLGHPYLCNFSWNSCIALGFKNTNTQSHKFANIFQGPSLEPRSAPEGTRLATRASKKWLHRTTETILEPTWAPNSAENVPKRRKDTILYIFEDFGAVWDRFCMNFSWLLTCWYKNLSLC